MGCLPSKSSSMMDVSAPTETDSQRSQRIRGNSKLVERRASKFDDNYSMGEEIGRGSFSEVREGMGIDGNQRVAVKTIMKKEGNSNLYDVLQEVKLMRKLSHKNIIKLLDFYEERDRYLLVMDMAAGNDLFTRVTARSYSEDEARRVFRNLLETIQYMHSHHVIHRDIKPENILMKSIDDPCDIYLADFGFAVEHEGEDLQEVVGTLQYAAPEVLTGKKYGKSVDVWSLGVLLFVLLTGTHPFPDSKPQLVIKRIVNGNHKFYTDIWEDVSDECLDLVQRILVVDVAKRYTIEDILSHPWISEETTFKKSLTSDTAQTPSQESAVGNGPVKVGFCPSCYLLPLVREAFCLGDAGGCRFSSEPFSAVALSVLTLVLMTIVSAEVRALGIYN